MSATQSQRKSSASGSKAPAKKAAKKAETQPNQRFSVAARARWDGKGKTDVEVRDWFLTCDRNEGLEALQTLRRHTEIAAIAYDENMQRGIVEHCGNCKKPFGPGQVYQRRTVVTDPVTQKSNNVFSCSMACYIEQFGKGGNPQVQGR